jgi:hypothetical protein
VPQRAISKSWLAFWEYLKKVDPRPFVYEIRRHHQHHLSSSLAFCRALQIFVFCCAFLSLYLFGYKIIIKKYHTNARTKNNKKALSFVFFSTKKTTARNLKPFLFLFFSI